LVRGLHAVNEEILVPFPGGGRREAVPPAQRFRSTWLSSSLRSLRERNLFDAYLANLPREHHEAILSAVVGVWLPIEVAVAHYDACDALALSSIDTIQIGRDAASRVHGTVLATFVRLAKGAGVTPWTVLLRLQELWERIWLGGGVKVVKLGPKEARIEIAGWPCARSTYCRVAMRGVIPAVTDLFCQKSYANEIAQLTTRTSLAYLISWA
jgi:hypothetical protein